MKKIFLIMFSFIFLLCGCKRVNEDTIKKDLNKYINNIKGYHMVGKLDVYNSLLNIKIIIEYLYLIEVMIIHK